MAYDHSGDLPTDYAFETVEWYLSFPEHMERASKRALNGNYLNDLGCRAIARIIRRFAGDFGGDLVTGAKLYAAITDTPHVGDDTVGTPTYTDVDGVRIAQEVAASLDTIQSPRDFELYVHTQFWEMDEHADQLRNLLDSIASSHTADERYAEHIKMGAAMLRGLHIDAARRSQSE